MRRLSMIAAVLSLPMPALAETVGCTVETLHGNVEGISGETRQILEIGSAVAIADRIETGAVARVTLLCPDELRIAVGPGSTVELVDLEGEAGWSAYLPRGIARFARPLFGGARFEVRTPSAVASVRSTIWTVGVEAGATVVFVTEGVVAVGEVELAAGEGIDIAADGTLGEASAWSPGRIAAFEARLTPVE